MDQMNAHVYELNGQIYRRNVPLENITQMNYAVDAHLSDAYEEDEFVNDCIETAGLEAKAGSDDESNNPGKPNTEKTTNYDFVKYDQKRKCYYSKMNMPTKLISSVIGFKGKQKALIEAWTSTKLILPKRNDDLSNVIEIQGEFAHRVEDARGRLELELIKARQKFPPTHFVSICLANDVNFSRFYNDTIEKILNCPDIPETCRNAELYRPVEKLHLTLSVLRLFSEEDERIAKKCINDLFDRELRDVLLGETKLLTEFSGLSFFGSDKANRVNVVYAKVISEKLQTIANIIDDNLTSMGLAVKRRTKDVVLHMTILNSKYAKNPPVKFIDARELMSRFGNFNLPNVEVNEVRICIMHEVDPYTNGYPTIFSVNF